MRAVTVTPAGRSAGERATHRVVGLPDPVPGPGQARVRVAAATVNPTDLALGSGMYGDLPDPTVPGTDLAGTVDAVGPGSSWAVGARVVGLVSPTQPSGGAQAELVVVDDDQLVATPASLDDVHAAALPLKPMTPCGSPAWSRGPVRAPWRPAWRRPCPWRTSPGPTRC